MENCLFCKIIAGKIPSEVIAESDKSIALNDISPQAPHHILVIPKKHHTGISEMRDPDEIADIILLANKISTEKKLNNGYRYVINQGEDGGQSVFHTHLHILAGRKLNWPPG